MALVQRTNNLLALIVVFGYKFLLGKENPDTRMRDVKMILRFFSLFYHWKKQSDFQILFLLMLKQVL